MQVYSESKDSLTVRLVEGSQPLQFNVSNADVVVKEIGTVLSRWQNQQPVRECTCKCMYVYINYLSPSFKDHEATLLL